MPPVKKVLVINDKLEIVKEYHSIKIAAMREGVNYNTFVHYISEGEPRHGVLYVMKEVWDTFNDREKEGMYRPTPDNPRPFVRKYKKSDSHVHVVNHTLPYSMAHNVICITPCPFLTEKSESDRPKVGSVNCTKCRYFVDRKKESLQVLCGFNRDGIKGMFNTKQ